MHNRNEEFRKSHLIFVGLHFEDIVPLPFFRSKRNYIVYKLADSESQHWTEQKKGQNNTLNDGRFGQSHQNYDQPSEIVTLAFKLQESSL